MNRGNRSVQPANTRLCCVSMALFLFPAISSGKGLFRLVHGGANCSGDLSALPTDTGWKYTPQTFTRPATAQMCSPTQAASHDYQAFVRLSGTPEELDFGVAGATAGEANVSVASYYNVLIRLHPPRPDVISVSQHRVGSSYAVSILDTASGGACVKLRVRKLEENYPEKQACASGSLGLTPQRGTLTSPYLRFDACPCVVIVKVEASLSITTLRGASWPTA